MKKIVLNSPRLNELKKGRRKKLQIKFIIYFLIILSICMTFVFISRASIFNFQNVVIEGNNVVDTNLIRDIVNKNLQGNYLYFIPKKNIFLYPKNKINRDLLSQFTRVESLSFSDQSLNKNKTHYLKISIKERSGMYTWCGDTPDPLNIKCYFLNDSGYIFDEAPYFSGEVYFKFYGKLDFSKETPVGNYFNKNLFNKLISFKIFLEKINVKLSAVYINDNGDVVTYISTDSIINKEIRFKKDTNIEKVEENLQSALDTEPLKSKFSSILYIDLRYGNKVYYKFQ